MKKVLKKVRISLAAAILASLIFCLPSAMPVKKILTVTGNWADNSGGYFNARQDGTTMVWYGKGIRGNFWHHVGTGSIRGNIINATFRDLPGST